MAAFLKNLLPARFRSDITILPVVRMDGVIATSSPMRQTVSLASLAGPLEKAFSMKQAPAVALVINSPGGSPVQSHLIFRRVRDLAEEHGKSVHVFVEDVAASGGYMIALAGDEIVVDPSSIVGSIGVISAGFGFDRAIEKLGIDRRVYTAGEKKMMLDAFQPEKPEEIKRLKALQKDIHDLFAGMVTERRGDKLKDGGKGLFTGEFWTGMKGVELGLADELGDMRSTLRRRYGDKVKPVLIQQRGMGLLGLLRRAPRVDSDGAASIGAGLIGALEERGWWSRYGL
ncbi:MAG: S49 family peptidase [Rhodobiaceae bacterium]|nr:S49 family peptidase [Rhodobiaceae bacterium]